MASISKRVVDALKPGAFVWDRNFGVKATHSGSKVYVLGYRIGRRRRRVTIGTHGSPWTPDSARKEAQRLMALVNTGVDPLVMKTASREAPTVRQLAERFLVEHVAAKRKPSTAKLYRAILEQMVVPRLGSRAVTDVTRADVAAIHHRHRQTPVHANRMLLVISKMMNVAERWGLRPDGTNPARHVERYPEQPRQRYLTASEFQRLGEALVTAERGPVPVRGDDKPVRLSPIVLAAIRLLIYTGARRSEILSLKWEHVDLEHGVLRLPTSKTGFKVVMLNAPATAVLTSLPRVVGNPYVLPGLREGRHLVNVTDTWYVVRDLADLKDVRIHDLRHSLASVGADAGLSLPIIGKLLGHSQAQTTQRYAHLSADRLKVAAEMIGAKIVAVMATR